MNAIQTSDDTECTAFSVACKNGHKDVVQPLLDSEDKNIELNARDNEGYTQFMIACEFGQKDVVQLLLDHLEDIHIYIINPHPEFVCVFAPVQPKPLDL